MKVLILAGGEAIRLQPLSVIYPKHLVTCGNEPLINHLLRQIKRAGEGSFHVEEPFYISVRKESNELTQNWMQGYIINKDKAGYQEYTKGLPDKIELVIDEKGIGPFQACADFITSQGIASDPDEVLLIAHGDNYFDFSLAPFIARFHDEDATDWPVMFMSYPIDDLNEAKRFGVIMHRNREEVMQFREKPQDISDLPNPCLISTGLYLMRKDAFAWLGDYTAQPNEKDFLEYVCDEHRGQLRHFEISKSCFWADVARPRDLGRIADHTRPRYDQPNNVEDLIEAATKRRQSDKYYLLVCKLEVCFENDTRTLKLYFRSDDGICKLKDETPGTMQSVDEIRDEFRNKEDDKAAFKQLFVFDPTVRRQTESFSHVFEPGLLLSGGIFLLDNPTPVPEDRAELPAEQATITLIPFLQKDLESPTDTARLTTPAGRVDDIDLERHFFSELAEEFVFYGVNEQGSRRILALKPKYSKNNKMINPAWQAEVVKILKHGRQEIVPPGFDRDELFAEKPEKMVVEVPWGYLRMPEVPLWTVETYLDDHLKHTVQKVYIVPDIENATLELRQVIVANISNFNGTTEHELKLKRLGRLEGIADGDGYGRVPLVFSAAEILRYYGDVIDKHLNISEYVFLSQKNSVSALAIGDPVRCGRFTRISRQGQEEKGDKSVRIPTVMTTTSVYHFLHLIACTMGTAKYGIP